MSLSFNWIPETSVDGVKDYDIQRRNEKNRRRNEKTGLSIHPVEDVPGFVLSFPGNDLLLDLGNRFRCGG